MADKKELSELEKLRVLIPHWIEHSHSHQHEFEKWGAVAKNEGQDEAAEAIDKALHTDGPVLVDFVVTPEENVMPMIPAGGGQTDFFGEGDE